MKYISKRFFKLWAYSVSHSTMILRSEIQYPDVEYSVKYEPNCTIDIEFVGVRIIDLNNYMDDLIVSQELLNIPEKFSDIVKNEKLKVFKIESSTEINYVVASGCIIGKSTWMDKDRVINFNLSYDEIIYSW